MAILACATLVSLSSCDRKPKQEIAPQTVTVAPATMPVRSPAPGCLVIDNARVNFPPSSLRVQAIDEKVVVSLTSGEKWTANDTSRMCFRMNLDADDAASFYDSDWRCIVRSGEPDESPHGIFLASPRRQLQPIDAKVSFDKTPDAGITLIAISGKFVETNLDDATIAPRIVSVAGEVEASTVIRN